MYDIQNYFAAPEHRPLIQVDSDKTDWAWQSMSRFYPTATVLRDGAINALPTALDTSIGSIPFDHPELGRLTVDEHVADATVDGLVVVRGGEVVYERYETMRPFDVHNWFSAGKSISGTLVALLEAQGKVDVSQPVSSYVDELLGSVWDTVTVEETLDMATGLDCTEHDEVEDTARIDPDAGWYRWGVTLRLATDVRGRNETTWDVFRSMQRRRPGHTAFEYNSMNTFLLGQIVERVTGTTENEAFGAMIWREIGAEGDGYIAISPSGYCCTFGFASSRLRDLARFGMIFTPSWRRLSDTPIVPEHVLSKIQAGGRPEIFDQGRVGTEMQQSFPDVRLSNRYQWDIVFPDGDHFKAGVGGQGLYVSASRDLVVAYFSTGKHREELLARTIALANG